MNTRERVSFSVAGKPVQKGSMKTFVIKPLPCKSCRNGIRLKAVVTNENTDTKKWQTLIGDTFLLTFKNHDIWYDCAISLKIVFYMPYPASLPKDRVYPCVKPDIDKLTRTILDALTGVLYIDDSQVVKLEVCKQYGLGGVEIEAINLTEQSKGAVLPGLLS